MDFSSFSAFTSRRDSNYVATDSESLEIQTFLKLPISRLEELSTQLQELDDQSTQLRNEQSSLLLFISTHRAPISPIRKLPIDILQEIFIACLPTAHNAVMSRWEPPILLTQVCSSWRNIALATPQLWKSIHIAVPCNKQRNSGADTIIPSTQLELIINRRAEAVLEWLSRSAACPLDISVGQLDSLAAASTLYAGGFDKIIDYLVRFSERWRDVRFAAPYQALATVATLPPSKVPLLETLFLNCLVERPYVQYDNQGEQYDDQRDHRSIWMTSEVMKAPKLRGLYLHGVWLHLQELGKYPEGVAQFPINWSQLTNISIIHGSSGGRGLFCLNIRRAYTLLSFCPNLITCRLEIGMRVYSEIGADEEPPLETNSALVSLPFLTNFQILENSRLSRLFTLLHLPSLNSIEFRTNIRPTPQSTGSLPSLLSQFHNTTKLITDSRFFKREDFLECLRLCPLLKSLSIRKPTLYHDFFPGSRGGFEVDDAFLKLFIESSNDEGYLCPHLEDFEISSGTAFSETTLLQFVKEKNGGSNTTGLAKLKHLSVVLYRRRLMDINQELKPYEQAGLVATITYPLAASYSAFNGLRLTGYFTPY